MVLTFTNALDSCASKLNVVLFMLQMVVYVAYHAII